VSVLLEAEAPAHAALTVSPYFATDLTSTYGERRDGFELFSEAPLARYTYKLSRYPASEVINAVVLVDTA